MNTQVIIDTLSFGETQVAMASKDQSVDELVTHYKEGHDKSNSD